MISEDTLTLLNARRNPVNSLQDLHKKLIGTRDGFIFYTSNFRNDLETKMFMLGQLEQEIKDLQQELTDYKERNEQLKNNWNELKKYTYRVIETDNELYGTWLLEEMKRLESRVDNDN